jgi:predicted PurR-regulated permease PerM
MARTKPSATTIFMLLLTLCTAWFGYLIASPYLKPVLTAIVLAVVVYPAHVRLRRLVRNASFAALLSTLLVLLLLVVPSTFLILEIKRELTAVYQAITTTRMQNGDWLPQLMQMSNDATRWLSQYVDLSDFDLPALLREKLQQASGYLLSLSANLIGNLTWFLISLFVAFLTLFFLLRDGRALVKRLMPLIPLQPAQRRNLLGSMRRTVTASMYGVVAVALAQGVLMGLAFWFLRLPSPVLCGVVTAIISLIPLIGSSVIWLPASALLMMNGQWMKGLILLGWGAGVVGVADNFIRPWLISRARDFHPLLVFFALLGGVQAFGLIGLFAGPVVLAVALALFDLLKEESRRKAELLAE